jgi:hypothetical protein
MNRIGRGTTHHGYPQNRKIFVKQSTRAAEWDAAKRWNRSFRVQNELPQPHFQPEPLEF